MAAVILLPVAAACLFRPAEVLRIDALALAAIMTAVLVLADLVAARPRASQPEPGVRRSAAFAPPTRVARPREPHPASGSTPHACVLCGAASQEPAPRPGAAWAQESFVHDMMLPGAALHMAANDDASVLGTAPADEDRDFWASEADPAFRQPEFRDPDHRRQVRDSPMPIPPGNGYAGSRAKHALDALAALLLLLALAPLFAAIWATLKLAGGGPALSRARRPDWSGRLFRTSNFVTSGHRPASDPTCLRALVTSYLHRTGLARLPLLLGVAKGHFSFVGPGPGRPCETIAERAGAAIVAELAERLGARPGLAGSAPIHAVLGDPALPASHAALVICDLFYLEHATPLLDLRILAASCARLWARTRR